MLFMGVYEGVLSGGHLYVPEWLRGGERTWILFDSSSFGEPGRYVVMCPSGEFGQYEGMASNPVREKVLSSDSFYIPKHLREYAELERDIIAAGVGNDIEIWDRVSYFEEMERISKL